MNEKKQIIEKEIYNYINYLYNSYKLPKFSVSQEEMNTLFSVVYTKLSESDKKDDYDAALHLIILRAANIASFSSENSFTIDYLISGIPDLYCLGLSYSDIQEMQDSIYVTVHPDEVLKYTK